MTSIVHPLSPPTDATDRQAMRAAAVYVRQNVGDAWQVFPGLYCSRVSKVCNGYGQAELRREHGSIAVSGASSFGYRAPLNLARWWVRLVWVDGHGTTQYWCGLIVGDAENVDGRQGIANAGQQTFIAYELSWLFERRLLTSSTLDADGNQTNYAFALNTDPHTGELVPNKHSTQLRYEWEPEDAVYWLPHHVMELLFAHLWADGNHPTIAWDVGVGSTWRPQLQLHKRSILDVLNELADPRRGYFWFLEHNVSGGATVKFATIAEANITLGGATVIPANPRRLTLLQAGYNTVVATILNRDTTNAYEAVTVLGAPIGSVFTLDASQGDLVEDWTTQQQEDYLDGHKAVDAGGYASLTPEQKKEYNDRYRTTPPVERVFSSFKVKADLIAADGSAHIFPITDGAGVWKSGGATLAGYTTEWSLIRLQTTLPLFTDVDYLEEPVDGVFPFIGTPNRTKEHKRGVAAIKIGDRWWMLDQLQGASRATSAGKNGIKWSADVRAYDHGSGIHLIATEPPHVFAKNTTGVEYIEPSHAKPSADWHDLRVTVYAESHQRAVVTYPALPDVTRNGMVSTKLIDVGDKFQQLFIVAGTVLGVESDGSDTMVTTETQTIKNNWQQARELAEMAFHYYSIERQNVRIQTAYVEGVVRCGDLIVELDMGEIVPDPVQTVVTAIEVDFDQNSTTINTSHAEDLDFGAFL